MRLGNVIYKGIMDRTSRLLAHALDYRARRHGVIAENLANIDTPGYKNKDIDFDDALRAAMNEQSFKLKITHPKHIPVKSTVPPVGQGEFPLRETSPEVQGQSQIDLDREMAKMAKNNLMYEATVRLLSKKFDELKAVIEVGRR